MPVWVRVETYRGVFEGMYQPTTGMIIGDREVSISKQEVVRVLKGGPID